MKLFLLSATLLVGLSAFAQDPDVIRQTLESQSQCGRLVQFDTNNLYMGFGGYRTSLEEPRQPVQGRLKVIPLGTTEEKVLSLEDSPLGIATPAGRLFILTYTNVEEWDATAGKKMFSTETYALGRIKAYQEHAQGWAQYKNKMIIAHGRLGVSFFDLDKKRLTNQYRLLREQAPLESMAMGVTIQGKYAFVVMDNFSLTRPPAPAPFRGVIIIDMETEKIVSQIPGLDPGGTSAMSDGGSVIVSYGGSTYWKYIIEGNGQIGVDPVSVRQRFPFRGHPTGISSMDDKYIYTCYLKAPKQGENGGRYYNIPVALDRKELAL